MRSHAGVFIVLHNESTHGPGWCAGVSTFQSYVGSERVQHMKWPCSCHKNPMCKSCARLICVTAIIPCRIPPGTQSAGPAGKALARASAAGVAGRGSAGFRVYRIYIL